ncbi:two-component system sensor histidine kinase ResE [Sinobaca qinghaiensis]|uniref:histidine kinase n=1 Tax=Sinobaca qinghaiensis TaxID=342944 RepID=A0A419V304_9BACL|nr:ATP-binding protein [Sinobaca qinghaiensis]RKD72899.1 two-component system sensor histidine kinase ResE [Sinobaca qinghaiensis]
MLWRSVVGKLWLTILLLVLVVLLILTFLLLQFFEQYHISEAEEQLTNHANVMVSILEEQEEETTRPLIERMAASYNTQVLVITEDEPWYPAIDHANNIFLPVERFYEDNRLSGVINEREDVTMHGDFSGSGEENDEIFVVGVPFVSTDGEESSLFLYQSLNVIEDTTGETQQIILLSAGIAIILTTVFTFFLSTRITAPLRKMRQLALDVVKGDFETKVPVISNDEIGQLGNAFNRMRRKLNQNITELNQEKEQLSRILLSMADGVITIDRKGAVVLTNPPADRFLLALEYQNEQEGRTTPLPKEMKKIFQQVVGMEQEQLAEVDVQGRSYAVLMTPLYDETFVRGAVAVIRDMTEERQHDKLRKDFIANVSHELRTPISMLQGYSEAIVDGIASTEEEKKEIGQIIYEESLRMGRLVNELLDLARMEAGYLHLEKEWMDVKTLTDKMEKKFQGLSSEAGLTLESSVKGDEAFIFADADRIEQVLTNLVHNAIRHTESGGSVLLEMTNNQDGLTAAVIDNGTGIPEEDLPFIFERFYKADKARTRSKGGTGLGLAIAKNIVEAHGGYIAAQSRMNEGTTFRFYIPSDYEKNEEQ